MAETIDIESERFWRAAEWKVEEVAVEGVGRRWAVVAYGHHGESLGAYCRPEFTDHDATVAWLVDFGERVASGLAEQN